MTRLECRTHHRSMEYVVSHCPILFWVLGLSSSSIQGRVINIMQFVCFTCALFATNLPAVATHYSQKHRKVLFESEKIDQNCPPFKRHIVLNEETHSVGEQLLSTKT